MSDIASRVKAIIVDKLGVDENEVVTEASFTNDLGADSLDTVELIMELEEEFGLEIILLNEEPVVTQNIFSDEGISFVSFTYRAVWNGDPSTLEVQTEEIAEVKWFDISEAQDRAVSHFDREALRSL